jgi:hypothetical protein
MAMGIVLIDKTCLLLGPLVFGAVFSSLRLQWPSGPLFTALGICCRLSGASAVRRVMRFTITVRGVRHAHERASG